MNFTEMIKDAGSFSIQRIRQNHALEHATLQVFAKEHPEHSLAGYSDSRGFWVLGEVALEDLQKSADEALRRLQNGEKSLAIHPNCGTNFVAAGAMAGTAAFVGMLGTGNSAKSKFDRWPVVMALATLAFIASQPVGPVLQQRFTTDADVKNVRIREIMRMERGGVPLHRVLTDRI